MRLDTPYDTNNIFAKILRGEAPAHTVYEDEHALAFMDLMPQADGHTLVIPKAPGANLFQVADTALAGTIVATKIVAAAVQQAFDADGVMIAQLNGTAAGQTVFHLHFHILPRNNGIDFRLHARTPAPAEILERHATLVRNALKQKP